MLSLVKRKLDNKWHYRIHENGGIVHNEKIQLHKASFAVRIGAAAEVDQLGLQNRVISQRHNQESSTIFYTSLCA